MIKKKVFERERQRERDREREFEILNEEIVDKRNRERKERIKVTENQGRKIYIDR